MPPKKTTTATKTTKSSTTSKSGSTKTTTGSKSTSKTTTKPTAKPAAKPAEKATDEAAAKPVERQILPMIEITVKELDAVVVKDAENRIKNTGRWAMVIDASGIAATFLRHRDSNVIDTLDQNAMDPERIRLALLGALRHGKPFVIHMLGVDMTEVIRTQLDKIRPGLLDALLDKTILQEDVYKDIIRESDAFDNNMHLISPDFLEAFRFIIITETPLESLMDRMCPVKLP